MTRDSLISTTSATTYPSTMSSRPVSALGLTESPTPTKSKGLLTRASRQNLKHLGSSEALRPVYEESVVSSERSQRKRPQATRERFAANVRVLDRTSQTSSAQPANPVARSQQDLRSKHPAAAKSVTPQRAREPVPASPALSTDTMAEDWEAELIKNAKNMHLGSMNRDIEERRQQDLEWERSGMWNAQRDMAREAEERIRRDAGREIAYPPKVPRMPVRAAATGVTSVHIGVRPRLHPDRHDESLMRNQPDDQLSPPLVTPVEEPGDPIAVKAKEQYEAWLNRKAEREEGFGKADDDWYGTREWAPRERSVARPGAVDGIAHSDGYEEKSLTKAVYPGYSPHDAYHGWYQNYWDPSWWQGEQTQRKVHFAPDEGQPDEGGGDYEQYE